MIRFLSTVIIISCTVSFTAQAQTSDTVLEKYFNAIGSVEKWKALKTIHYSGRAFNSQLSSEYPISIYEQAPNKIKQVSLIQGEEVIEAYDGTKAWSKEGGEISLMGQRDTKELTANPFESPLIDYKNKGHEVTLLELEAIDGVQCNKILLKEKKDINGEQKAETYYFDTKAHRLLLKKRASSYGELWVYYSDYRQVDGLYFPFVVEVKVSGQLIQKRMIDKVTLNEVFANDFFTMPPDSIQASLDSADYNLKKVEQLDAAQIKAPTSNWAEVDYNLVTQKLLTNLLADQRFKEFNSSLGRKPVVTFGDFKSDSQKPVDVDALMRKFEYEIFKSNVIDLLESTQVRNAVRKERAEQSEFERNAALTKWGKEAGADMILFGELKLLTEAHRGKSVDNYIVSLFLTDIVTNKRIWIGQEEVKKSVKE